MIQQEFKDYLQQIRTILPKDYEDDVNYSEIKTLELKFQEHVIDGKVVLSPSLTIVTK